MIAVKDILMLIMQQFQRQDYARIEVALMP